MAKQTEVKHEHPIIDDAEKFIHTAIEEIRNLSHSLISPFLNEYGLLKALDHLIQTISNGSTLLIKPRFCSRVIRLDLMAELCFQ